MATKTIIGEGCYVACKANPCFSNENNLNTPAVVILIDSIDIVDWVIDWKVNNTVSRLTRLK